jgi:aerobic-type carbon monoxide dehydrogenase small subunit (CoxS/CutS family)
MSKTIHLKVNGKPHTLEAEPGTMLLYPVA